MNVDMTGVCKYVGDGSKVDTLIGILSITLHDILRSMIGMFQAKMNSLVLNKCVFDNSTTWEVLQMSLSSDPSLKEALSFMTDSNVFMCTLAPTRVVVSTDFWNRKSLCQGWIRNLMESKSNKNVRSDISYFINGNLEKVRASFHLYMSINMCLVNPSPRRFYAGLMIHPSNCQTGLHRQNRLAVKYQLHLICRYCSIDSGNFVFPQAVLISVQ